MATSVVGTDIKIYDDQFHTGLSEGIDQRFTAFNQASLGSITLMDERIDGDFQKAAFLKRVNGLVSRRDPTDLTSATSLKVVEDELIGVKVESLMGPLEMTMNSFKKMGIGGNVDWNSPEVISLLLGEYVALEILVDKVNTAIRSVSAAIGGQAAIVNDITAASTKTLNTEAAIDALAKSSDSFDDIVLWVCHGKPYWNWVKEQAQTNRDGITNFVIQTASPVTLNRPVLVIDSPGLVTTVGSGTSAQTAYYTLGLRAGAVNVKNAEPETMYGEIVTGLKNLVVRLQGEGAYMVDVRGFKWDVTNGGKYPSDSALGTGTNWDKAVTSDKHLAGVAVLSL